MPNQNDFNALVNQVSQAHEELTGDTPDTAQFAEIKAVVREELEGKK